MSRDARTFFLLVLGMSAIPYLGIPVLDLLLPKNPSILNLTALIILAGSSCHVAAGFLFYLDPSARSYMAQNKTRFMILPAVAIVVATCVPLFSSASFGAAWVAIYWIWQVHHYARQNQGILSFIGKASGSPGTLSERVALTLTGLAGIVGMSNVVILSGDPDLHRYAWQVHMVAMGAYALGWGAYLASLRERNPFDAPLRGFVVFTLMLFYLPIFLFTGMTAIWPFALAHGFQYFVFMYYVGAYPADGFKRRILILLVMTVVGGTALRYGANLFDAPAVRSAVAGGVLGVVMWHFLLDAGIWKLSEAFPLAYMKDRFSFLRS